MKFKFVNAPAEGKKFGSVKTPDNKSFLFLPGPIDLKPDVEYDVETKTEKWKDKDVTLIVSVDGTAFQTNANPKGGGGKGGGYGGARSVGNPCLDFAGRVLGGMIAAGKVTTVGDITKFGAAAYNLAKDLTK